MHRHIHLHALTQLCSVTFMALGITACQPSVQINEQILDTGVSLELAHFRKSNLKDIRYRLFFDIPMEKDKKIRGKAEITCFSDNPEAFILDFKAPENQIDSVCLNGMNVPYQFLNEHIRIDKDVKAGENSVSVYFTSPDQSLNRRNDFLYTLLVPDRARTVFPCFDQPDLKARYELSLKIPPTWKAVANGKVLSVETTEEEGRTFISFQQTEPISTYLFSFVAGKMTQESFHRGNRTIDIYHRESAPQKTAQCPAIASEVFDALEWMEEYTGIPYPFAKYDVIIVPGFQFGGMEHVGATLYTDSRMFLNKQATLREQLIRSSLIAHETAHMWFGDYVTMKWFDDVWTKEVFANYFASLITEPRYPQVNHRLNFMLDYIPGAYGEDRTAGSNSIKQDLDNLEHAGLVYGNIIYNKSPWVMNALSDRMGKEAFRTGMQQYLRTYANANATWDDLIAILDEHTTEDLKSFSHAWVNEKGRPTIQAKLEGNQLIVSQSDEWKRGVSWPQKLAYTVYSQDKQETVTVNFTDKQTTVNVPLSFTKEELNQAVILPNIDGKGYGLFLLEDKQQEAIWTILKTNQKSDTDTEVLRGSLLINLYENLRHGSLNADTYQKNLISYIEKEQNQLLYTLALGYLSNCQKWYDTDPATVEEGLWKLATTHPESGHRLQAFRYFSSLAKSDAAIQKLYTIWKKQSKPGNCQLSEKDFMRLAYTLALNLAEKADDIIQEQAKRIEQPDRQKEFSFISAAVSPSESKRDSVFALLLEKENRTVEPWASDALSLLNHPVHGKSAVKYIRPALEEMQEIQRTGDIFFPRAWARALLSGHTSHEAAEEVRRFFAEHPNYPKMLGNKIKQQAEHLETK